MLTQFFERENGECEGWPMKQETDMGRRMRKKCFAIIIFNLWIDTHFILFGSQFADFLCRFFRALYFPPFPHSQNVLAIGNATWTNFGYPRWELVLCLAFGWIVAFLCLAKGIKSAGKTVFFVVIFPYVILTVLLVSWDFSSIFTKQIKQIHSCSFFITNIAFHSIEDSKFNTRRCIYWCIILRYPGLE